MECAECRFWGTGDNNWMGNETVRVCSRIVDGAFAEKDDPAHIENGDYATSSAALLTGRNFACNLFEKFLSK